MPSNNFLQIAKKTVNGNPELFNTLMEFEKKKKIATKTRLNFTIDKSVASNFKKFCREHGYNMSAKVEQALKQLIEKGD
jgi:hypothetical protein